MTTMTSGHYRFTDAARMEWVKLRSLRSTWWTLAVTIAAAAGIAVAVGVNTENAAGDLTNNLLAGISVGLLLTGTSGTIRSTLAAIPNRPLVLAAKAAVFGAVALATGEAAAFVSFLAGRVALPARIAGPALGQPGVLRAVVLGGAGYCLIGLLGLGFGAVVRHTALAVGLLVGGVYVVAMLGAPLAPAVMPWLPIAVVANSLTVVQPGMAIGDVRFLSPWAGLGVLVLYAAVALGAGAWVLAERDA
jgi:ABC-2 type transport system permease protein